MILRVEVSGAQCITYTQEYDAENRLTVVTNTVTGEVVRFVYDGDGKRVLRIGPEGMTVYIGDFYEAFYPWTIGGSDKYGPYEPMGVGATSIGGITPCDLQCPDGYLDRIQCRCIYPTPEPNPTATPGPSPTPTPMPPPAPPPAVVTKYYYAGSQRIAMREGGVLYYLHTDHLGSTSLATTSSGAVHSRQGYYPYGDTR